MSDTDEHMSNADEDMSDFTEVCRRLCDNDPTLVEVDLLCIRSPTPPLPPFFNTSRPLCWRRRSQDYCRSTESELDTVELKPS